MAAKSIRRRASRVICPIAPYAQFRIAILLPMRIHSPIPLLLGAVILAMQLPPAAAQSNQTLKLVRVASDVASHLQAASLDGGVAIYIAPVTWTEAMTDSYFGPFLATQDPTPSRSAVCLFSKMKDRAVCVYFDGAQAYGFTSVTSDSEHPFTAASAAASYRPITPDLLQAVPREINFTATTAITLDDGQQLTAFSIKLGK